MTAIVRVAVTALVREESEMESHNTSEPVVLCNCILPSQNPGEDAAGMPRREKSER